MLIFKLAYRNIKGAGLRTWLNVAVLSLIYVLIIAHQGIFSGMLRYGTHERISDEIGGGQYWHRNYDPYDPLSLDDSHGLPEGEPARLINEGKAVSILIRPASIYPEGRIQTIMLKGIDPDQKILNIPTSSLQLQEDILPVLLGKRMAKRISAKKDDYITIRWRDVNGTFDAVEGKITEIMNTGVPAIDNGQLWIPLKALQEMIQMPGEATMIVVGSDVTGLKDTGLWKFRNHDFLLKDIHSMVKSKRVSSSILYAILLFMAMLAVFDTQILAIFRRRKEIGTLIALGMTRLKVVALFTLEGAMHGILAAVAGAVYGIPLIIYFAKTGMKMPEATDSYGFTIAETVYPLYSVKLVLVTVLIVMATVTVVSFMPSRKIAKMKPTDALKGKIS